MKKVKYDDYFYPECKITDNGRIVIKRELRYNDHELTDESENDDDEYESADGRVIDDDEYEAAYARVINDDEYESTDGTVLDDDKYNSTDGRKITDVFNKFYKACKAQESEDDEIFKIFQAYLEEQSSWIVDDIVHIGVVVPDSWDSSVFAYIKQQIERWDDTQIKGVEIRKKSDALIRYLQHPAHGLTFKNGENYIVCLFNKKEDVIMYAYEIGRPIKGLKNINSHSVVLIEDITLYYDIAHTMELILAHIKQHCSRYYGTKMIAIRNTNNYNFIPNKLLHKKTGLDVKSVLFNNDYGDHMLFISGMHYIVQDLLRLFNYVPRIIDDSNISRLSNIHIVDIQWDKNTATYHTHNNQSAFIDISTFPTLNQCFVFHDSIYGSNIRNVDITDDFNKSVNCFESDKNTSNYKRKKEIKTLLKERSENRRKRTSMYYKVKRKLKSIWMIGSSNRREDIYPTILDLSKLIKYSYAELTITTSDTQMLLVLYIMGVLNYIEEAVPDKWKQCQYMISVQQTVLSTFMTDYEAVREQLLQYYNKTTLTIRPIIREQLSAVYFNKLLKYHEQFIDRYDYPRYIVHAHITPMHVNFTLSTVLPLTEKISTWEDMTTLTLRRVLVQFSMMDMMVDCLWDHIMETEYIRITPCNQHTYSIYSDEVKYYYSFKECFHGYMTNVFLSMSGDIDWYSDINLSINAECDCKLSISNIDILDMCVMPAISHLISLLLMSFTNNVLMHDYTVHDLIVMGTPLSMKKDTSIYSVIMDLFKKRFLNQNKYFNTSKFQYINDRMNNVLHQSIQFITQYPKCGLLEQVFSGDYGVGFNHKNIYIDHGKTEIVKKYTSYPIVKKGERITEIIREEGVSLTFYFQEYTDYMLYFECYHDSERVWIMTIAPYISRVNYPGVTRLIPTIDEIHLIHNCEDDEYKSDEPSLLVELTTLK